MQKESPSGQNRKSANPVSNMGSELAGPESVDILDHGLVQRVRALPKQLSTQDVQALQRTVGNRAVAKLVGAQRGGGYPRPTPRVSAYTDVHPIGSASQPSVQRVEDEATPQDLPQDSPGKSIEKTGKLPRWQQTEAFGMSSWRRNPESLPKPVRAADQAKDAVSNPNAKQPDKPFDAAAWTRDQQVLLQRVQRIKPLADHAAFLGLMGTYISILEQEGQKLGDGKPKTGVADGIIDILESVRGLEVPYNWFVANQDKPNFRSELLPEKAQAASGHGRFWSKLYTRRSIKGAEPSENAPEGGVLLESSVAGTIFNGLDFGMPAWNTSATMGYLWERLSSTYAGHLHGTVEADVLDGRDPASVLSTLEWHRLREAIFSGKVERFIVNIHEFRNNQFKVVKQVHISKENLTDWFGQVPEVPNTEQWSKHQKSVDRHEKLFANMDAIFGNISKDVISGKRLLTVEDVRQAPK